MQKYDTPRSAFLLWQWALILSYACVALSCGKEVINLPRRPPCVGEGCSKGTGEATAVPPAVVLVDVPKNFAAVPGDRQVSLSWDGVEGASEYSIFWNNVGGVDLSANEIKVKDTRYVHPNLSSNKVYYYTVIARQGSAFSKLSKERAARPSFGVYVSSVGDDLAGVGTIKSPFKSIRHAIDSTSGPIIIHLTEGQFKERVFLSRSIQLVGGYDLSFSKRDFKTHTTLIDMGQDVQEDLDNPYIAQVEVNTVSEFIKIEGLTIKGPRTAAANYGIGLLVQGSSRVEVVDSKIEGGALGSVSYGALISQSFVRLTQSSIDGGAGSYSYGLACSIDCQLIAEGNEISGGSGSYGSFGVSDETSQVVLFQRNKVDAGAGTLRYGARVVKIESKKLYANNTFTSAPAASPVFIRGVELSNLNGSGQLGEVLFVNNTISLGDPAPSSKVGIFVDQLGGSKATVANNIIQVLGSDGYSLYGIFSAATTAKLTQIRNNAFDGCSSALYRSADELVCEGGLVLP